MSRDDSSGGWVPLAGGGLSNVSVRKRPRSTAPPPSDPSVAPPPPPPPQAKQRHDYLIYGRRISDDCTVLRCTIKKDFEYNKVMPTFHHWRTEDKRYGLTFQTAADARAFDKGVRTAVEELLDGFADTFPYSTLRKCQSDVGDDDVFMTLNLPQEAPNSRSSSDTSSKGSGAAEQPPKITSTVVAAVVTAYDPLKPPPPPAAAAAAADPSVLYPYVQLTMHEYAYPIVKGVGRGGGAGGASPPPTGGLEDKPPPPPPPLMIGLARRDSGTSVKKEGGPRAPPAPPPGAGAPPKKPRVVKLRCRHCQELYIPERNRRGACDYGPDRVRRCVDTVTCIGCAQALTYHCLSGGGDADAGGDEEEADALRHPCTCVGAPSRECARRWVCLALLALCVPCLCLHPPLRLCHAAAVRCGLCGARHNVMPNN